MSAATDLEHVGDVSVVHLARRLGLSLTELARLARLHRNTLARNPGSPAVQTRLGEIEGLLQTATEMNGGDPRRATIWFRHQPLAGFRGETAEQLVAAGRADAVRYHLEVLADGGHA